MKRKLKEHLEVILTIHAVATEDGTCEVKVEQEADAPYVFVMENISGVLRALADTYDKQLTLKTEHYGTTNHSD